MTNHRALHTVRMAIVSMVFALAAFSLLAVGMASAQTVSSPSVAQGDILQGNNPTVHIVANQQGLAAYSPNTITVSIKQAFTIVNNTKASQVLSGKGFVSFTLIPGASTSISFNQLGQFQLALASTNTTLIVNVVPFRG